MSPEMYPPPGEGTPCGRGVLPVAMCAGAAPHPHPPGLAGPHLAAVVVAEPHFEARDRGAKGAGTHASRPVRDEDVPHFGGAEAVEEFDAEGIVPASVEGNGKRLAGGGGQPEADEVAGVRLGVRDHVVHHCGHVDENRGAVPFDLREELVGGAALWKQDGRRPRGEREEEIGTGGIAEVELGNRERDVVGRVAEHSLRIALGRVGEGGVALDHALGAAGGAAGEEPDSGVVEM